MNNIIEDRSETPTIVTKPKYKKKKSSGRTVVGLNKRIVKLTQGMTDKQRARFNNLMNKPTPSGDWMADIDAYNKAVEESIWNTYKNLGSILIEGDAYAAFGDSEAAKKRRAEIKKRKDFERRSEELADKKRGGSKKFIGMPKK